jgi:hypothetical protein
VKSIAFETSFNLLDKYIAIRKAITHKKRSTRRTIHLGRYFIVTNLENTEEFNKNESIFFISENTYKTDTKVI